MGVWRDWVMILKKNQESFQRYSVVLVDVIILFNIWMMTRYPYTTTVLWSLCFLHTKVCSQWDSYLWFSSLSTKLLFPYYIAVNMLATHIAKIWVEQFLTAFSILKFDLINAGLQWCDSILYPNYFNRPVYSDKTVLKIIYTCVCNESSADKFTD